MGLHERYKRTTKAQTSLRSLISAFVIRYLKKKASLILHILVGFNVSKASGYAPELYIIIIGPRREKNLSLEFLTNGDSNQPAKLWRLARKLKFR